MIKFHTVHKIVNETTEMSVSDPATKILQDFLNRLAEKLSKDAGELTTHGNRKIIQKHDMVKAIKNL